MLSILLVLTMTPNIQALSDTYAVRLVNGTKGCSGRVEVSYWGHWGTVCDANWGMPNAQVVCRELGCGNVVTVWGQAHYGKGTVFIWEERVMCKGDEMSLADCKERRIGRRCTHDNDAGIECAAGSAVTQPDTDSSNAPRWTVALVVMVLLLVGAVLGICLFFLRHWQIRKLETVHRTCESNVYTFL